MRLTCETAKACEQLHAPMVEATLTLMLVAVVVATVGFYAYREYRYGRLQDRVASDRDS